MENPIKYLKTLTVEQFKDKVKVSKVDVKRNPQTGKLFMVYGAETARCSQKVPEHPMVSLVRFPDSDHDEWFLHNEGTGPAVTVATF